MINHSVSYPALNLPRLTGGVGIRTGTTLWGTAVAMGLVADSFWMWVLYLTCAALLHMGMVWMFRKDHHLFEAYSLYLLSADKYEAGMSVQADGFQPRPNGYGKKIPC